MARLSRKWIVLKGIISSFHMVSIVTVGLYVFIEISKLFNSTIDAAIDYQNHLRREPLIAGYPQDVTEEIEQLYHYKFAITSFISFSAAISVFIAVFLKAFNVAYGWYTQKKKTYASEIRDRFQKFNWYYDLKTEELEKLLSIKKTMKLSFNETKEFYEKRNGVQRLKKIK